MKSIKEYAKEKQVSYEAVRKQISRYKDELKGHIQKVGRTQYLDEEAEQFLNEKRNSSPVVLIQASKDEELEALRKEKEMLLLKVAELQDQLLKEKDQVKNLQEEKILLLEQKNKTWWQKLTGKKVH